MAPDLNLIGRDGKWDYSTPGSSGYNVPDITFADPQNRRLKVITCGAGISGIMMAYQIQKQCANVEQVVYDKNSDIGGTWFENRYPGAGCDLPSHGYTLAFALNPDWPRYFSLAGDVRAYLAKVVDVFGLRQYMRFDCKIVEARFDEARGKWRLKIQRVPRLQPGRPGAALADGGDADGEPGDVFEDECDLFLNASGVLNNYQWPDIPGLSTFKGRVCHTARWPEDYQAEQWKGENVAIIGAGSSSLQALPAMQPQAKHIDTFVRTGNWFVELAGHGGINKEYTEAERAEMRADPQKLVDRAKSIEEQLNALWGAFYQGSETQKMIQEMFRQRMAGIIKDERLLRGFTPNFDFGCRRVTPGDPYLLAIQEPNVDVHFTHVERVTPDGVVGGDGIERKCDTIVCATGFDTSYRPRFPIIGLNGIDLREKWRDAPESYLGLGAADMPNFLMFIGPTWPVLNGGVLGPLMATGEYAIKIAKKMQADNIKSWMPKQEVSDQFNAHVQEWYKHTVWKESCRSWYKNSKTGRINSLWPGSALHFRDVVCDPRYEDFDIKYHDKNMWAHLGIGYSMNDRSKELSAHLDVKGIDPLWLEAVGMPVPEEIRKDP